MPNHTQMLVARQQELNEVLIRQRRLQQEVADLEKLAQLKRARPLDDQITAFMQSLPPARRDRDWSMADLLPHLTGKYRAHPHAKEVGQALRRLGWSRERRYRNDFDGARVWTPPQL